MKQGTLVTTAMLALGLASAAAAQTEYQVTIDTSTLSGTTGNVDFQFNPFGAAPAATDTITGFTSDGSLLGAPALTGGAVGSLPGAVTITNSTGFNDYFQTFTFGTSLTFDTTFTGAIGINTFAFSLYGSDGTTPLLTNASDGSIADITTNLDGSFSTQANPNADGSASVASLVVVPPSSAVPEASSLTTFTVAGMGLLGLMVIARKRKAVGAAS